ncbi:hypothetical protein GDO78_010552, partial [Eleutherodactylus coqui]
ICALRVETPPEICALRVETTPEICAPYCKITCGEDPGVWTRFEKNFASLGHHLTSLSEDDSCGEEPDIWPRFVQRT